MLWSGTDRGIFHESLVFSSYSVYAKKIQVTSGVFYGIPRENIAFIYKKKTRMFIVKVHLAN